MKIAMDAEEMQLLRKRLRAAAEEVERGVPEMPGAAAFGSAVLAGAAAQFETEMRRRAEGVQSKWNELEAGLQESLADMSEVEASIVEQLRSLAGAFA